MAGLNRLPRLALVVAFGAAAYWAAAGWSRWRAQDQEIDSSEIVAAVTRNPASAAATGAPPTAVAAAASAALPGRRLPSALGLAFSPTSWLPPEPPPPPVQVVAAPPPPPPPAPVAPTLPFALVGMVERGADRPQAYLAKGEALLIVAVGDLLENGKYRVEALSPTSVILTYLPLNQQQSLNVPGPSP
jgi:hypothetical protein